MKTLFLAMLFLFTSSLLSQTSLDSEEIKKNLSDEAGINHALLEIKSADETLFKELNLLKKSNSKEFGNRLYNAYYILLQKKSADKTISPRPLGYREKVKSLDIRFKELNAAYKLCKTDAEKSKVITQIKATAGERFQTELEHKKLQLKRLETILNRNRKEIENFESSKETYTETTTKNVLAL